MAEQYHILNGDAMKEQFPKQIPGEIIVTRECLIEGPVGGDSLEEFFEIRSSFIQNAYGDFGDEDYDQKTVSEFSKMKNIPAASEINLWFEDDLFCQVNFWFVCSLLSGSSNQYSVYLIRPEVHTRFGFGGLNEEELITIFKNRKKLEEIEKLAELWTLYQEGKTEEMSKIAIEMKNEFPFLLPAIQAHIDRISSKENPGRPIQSLKEIKEDLNTDDFGSIFKEFSKREAIYGFGDLQVKRLLNELPKS